MRKNPSLAHQECLKPQDVKLGVKDDMRGRDKDETTKDSFEYQRRIAERASLVLDDISAWLGADYPNAVPA
eukprot:49424-Eustigmatos_ZCMA.PRE.1